MKPITFGIEQQFLRDMRPMVGSGAVVSCCLMNYAPEGDVSNGGRKLILSAVLGDAMHLYGVKGGIERTAIYHVYVLFDVTKCAGGIRSRHSGIRGGGSGVAVGVEEVTTPFFSRRAADTRVLARSSRWWVRGGQERIPGGQVAVV